MPTGCCFSHGTLESRLEHIFSFHSGRFFLCHSPYWHVNGLPSLLAGLLRNFFPSFLFVGSSKDPRAGLYSRVVLPYLRCQ
jgi:hypothetical protein